MALVEHHLLQEGLQLQVVIPQEIPLLLQIILRQKFQLQLPTPHQIFQLHLVWDPPPLGHLELCWALAWGLLGRQLNV